jgi:tyrosinase
MTPAKKQARAAARKSKAAASSYGVAAETYSSSSLSLEGIRHGFTRADLKFDGVDHAQASFEARVFLNNTKATDKTPLTSDQGYAGRFHIFGHGGCFGDVGHCEVRGPRRPYDPRSAHPLTPATKTVIATEAIRKAMTKGTKVTVTVVPIVLSGTKLCDYKNVLKFDKISVVTYQ